MKKFLLALSFLLVLTATPVIAAQNNNSQSECNADGEWKNHGEYVSCVAHEHPGGTVVSTAAQSDIGKKFEDEDIDDEDIDDDEDEDEDETSPSPSASPSPSVSPSPEVSPSSEVSPSPEISPSPEVSPNPSLATTVDVETGAIEGLIVKLQQIIEKLQNLL